MQHGNSARTGQSERHVPTSRKDLILAMRKAGMPLRAIASSLGVSTGAVTWSIYGNRPRVVDTARSVVRRIPVLGWQGSGSSYDVAVSLPRVSIIDRAFGGPSNAAA